MKRIDAFKLKGKRVLVRCDFNVSFGPKGEIIDTFRIEEAIATIDYLASKGARVILLSHLGDPKGKFVKELSLSSIQDELTASLDYSVVKAPDCLGKEIEKWIKQMQEGEILLLENLRFYSEEKENNASFAKSLSKLGDLYVNEAFSVSHRKHASVVGIPKFLPSAVGFRFFEEVQSLERFSKNPKRPALAIIGGAKLESKLKPLPEFLEKADEVLTGGKIGNALLMAKGLLPKQLSSEEEKLLEKIDLENKKLVLPVDVFVKTKEGAKAKELKETGKNDLVYDIGPKTQGLFVSKIEKAKTLFWAGPLGNIEEPGFEKGSLKIAEAVGRMKGFALAGGGDTIAFLNSRDLANNFDYLSTAGGAMLDYLAQGTLPGIEALS